VYGQLRDVYSGRRMMFVALAIFIGASLFCAAATSIEMLAVGRILQGLGGGGLMTLSQALIGEAIPPRERARFQGYLAAVMVTSSTFGPVAGGYLTEHLGWRSIFLVNVPLGVIAVLLTLRLPTRPVRDQPWTFDTFGLLLLIAFIAPSLLALDQVRYGQAGALTAFALLMGFGLAALVALIRHERRAAFPLLPITLLRQPTIWRSDALAACHGATLVSLLTFLPIWMHVGQGRTAAQTGLMLLPLVFGIGAGSMLTGRVVSRTGFTTIFPSVGLIFVTLSLVILGLWGGGFTSNQLGAFLFFEGLFMGTVMGVVQVTVQNAVCLGSLGAAVASVQLSRSIGAAIGTALVGTVLFATLASGDGQTASLFASIVRQDMSMVAALSPARQAVLHAEIAGAFRSAFLTIAAFAAIGTLVAWSIPSRRLT
jgi:predicted MFS family arabinose efflux permease